jgi:hypothetical protein
MGRESKRRPVDSTSRPAAERGNITGNQTRGAGRGLNSWGVNSLGLTMLTADAERWRRNTA